MCFLGLRSDYRRLERGIFLPSLWPSRRRRHIKRACQRQMHTSAALATRTAVFASHFPEPAAIASLARQNAFLRSRRIRHRLARSRGPFSIAISRFDHDIAIAWRVRCQQWACWGRIVVVVDVPPRVGNSNRLLGPRAGDGALHFPSAPGMDVSLIRP